MLEKYFTTKNMMNSKRNKLRNWNKPFNQSTLPFLMSFLYKVIFSWSRELTMKYVYSGGFNITRCMERLKKHLEWRVDSTF